MVVPYVENTSKFQIKDICHIWELGSNITFVSLLDVVAKVKYNHPLSVVLVLDLTSAENLLNIVDVLLNSAKAAILKSLEAQRTDLTKRIIINAEVPIFKTIFRNTYGREGFKLCIIFQ